MRETVHMSPGLREAHTTLFFAPQDAVRLATTNIYSETDTHDAKRSTKPDNVITETLFLYRQS